MLEGSTHLGPDGVHVWFKQLFLLVSSQEVLDLKVRPLAKLYVWISMTMVVAMTMPILFMMMMLDVSHLKELVSYLLNYLEVILFSMVVNEY